MHPQGHYVKSVGPTQCVDRTLVGLGDSSLGTWEGRTSVRVLGSGQYHGEEVERYVGEVGNASGVVLKVDCVVGK